MSNPTLDDVASMSGEDFAQFAASYQPPQDGEVLPPEQVVEQPPEPEAPVVEPTDGETPPVNAEDEQVVEQMSPEDFYAALTAPMKAAGKEFSFTDPEEIRDLMQKGVGMAQRMGKIKKFQRHMETLDKENLLGDDTLNLIIDLARGKPEALKQYIENNKIDVYDVIGLDTEAYQPEKHVPSEEEYEQSQVVQEIKSYEGYDLIKSIAEEDWDEKSRNQLLADPQLAQNMIAAAKAGIHDMVLVEAEKVKLLASQPMSDFEAYIAAGNKLHTQGAFDKMTKKASDVDETIKPKNIATNSNKRTKETGIPSMQDIANMSPEELRKFAEMHDL